VSRTVRIIHRLNVRFGHERYDTAATLRLCPVDGGRQRLLHHRVHVDPEPTMRMVGEDGLGNTITELAWETLPALTVTATSAVELELSGSRLDHVEPELHASGTPYAPTSPRLAILGRESLGTGPIDAGSLFRFAKQMRSLLSHDDRWTRIRRSALDALERGAGAHADYAHLAVAILRSLGHPACYVSGYLLPPSGAGTPAAHAWIAVHTPTHGWLELDPMLGCPVDLRHVAISTGRDRSDVDPIESQNLLGGICRVEHAVRFYPLTRTPVPAPPAALAS
jgi:transglutaminase-like putative cysteine protease